MPDPDYKALCAELVDIATAHCHPDDDAVGYCAAVLSRARAALSQPEPQGPTDEGLDELVQRLLARFHTGDTLEATWAIAAQWGADQELELCCEWLTGWDTCEGERLASLLREGRRPKPPSLKEQALKELAWVDENLDMPLHNHCNAIHTIRRALEALPE